MGDRVCFRGEEEEFVVADVNKGYGPYTLISVYDHPVNIRHEVRGSDVWKCFWVGESVVDLLGRRGVVYRCDPKNAGVDVVFEEPSANQLRRKNLYETTQDGRFVTRIDRNSLKKNYFCNTIKVEAVEFDEDDFLKMIGGM